MMTLHWDYINDLNILFVIFYFFSRICYFDLDLTLLRIYSFYKEKRLLRILLQDVKEKNYLQLVNIIII